MSYPCQHDGDGYKAVNDDGPMLYKVWVCGKCGHEIPIDSPEAPDPTEL